MINTLISKKSCKVAPIPGETKIWQYITLFKRISLIDCPGVVVDTAGDTETDCVLKGVVRAERLETPEDFIQPIVDKVKREHIAGQYKFTKEDSKWETVTELLETMAMKAGRLLKGGEPCLRSSAITMINDFQRGRLPFFIPPPDLKEDDDEEVKDIGQENLQTVDVKQQIEELDKMNDESTKSDEMVEVEETGNTKIVPVVDEPVAIADGEWDD